MGRGCQGASVRPPLTQDAAPTLDQGEELGTDE